MAARFEHIKGYEDLPLPVRGTLGAAGYDFVVGADIVVPSFFSMHDKVCAYALDEGWEPRGTDLSKFALTLDQTADYIKAADGKLTLVPTGVCCHLDPGTYLELSVRSSTPLKNWLILANGVGIIDEDFVLGDTGGHIHFQLINLAPWPIQLKKGDRIGQGIIKPYLITEDDNCTGNTRTGGFGSSSVGETA